MPPRRTRPLLALAAVSFLAIASPLSARTDVRKPLAETHACMPVGRYCLQSNVWVNLHQRLVHEALYGGTPPKSLAGNDLARWRQAVERYRAWLGDRNPIFDHELVELNAALSRTTREALPDSIPKDAREVLASVMPMYRKAQWKADARGNRFYIQLAKPLLEQAGPEIIAAHEKAYGVAFPTRILVDVTAVAGRFGAYTVGQGDDAHVVQSHTTPGMHGFGALESLIHEPSHSIVAADWGAIGGDIAKASAATGVKPRDNLWHAVLFYTAGELTRRAYARRGIAYTPVIAGRYDGPFKGMQKPLETHWQAYLEGKVSRSEAMERVLVETSGGEVGR